MTPNSKDPTQDAAAVRPKGAAPEALPGADPTEDAPADGSLWGEFERSLGRIAEGSAATVLLTGESGAGKSFAARRIHDASSRSAGPFVSVHLAGLASTLLEAELFGHAAGAFTGADRAREGRFVRASGGTIVLEAIETLAYALQVKLLRVLQERVVEPLGAEASIPVDVRVVATTAQDLRRSVAEGEFREDLYYRLAVVPLTVPPLRTRSRSVAFAPLLDRVAASVARRIGVPQRPLTDEARAALAAHPWPGNFRELENAFERAFVLGPASDPIEAQEFAFLAEGLRGRASEIAALALASGVTLDELDHALIDGALRQERGNLSAAARCVGLSRRAFDYRRKKLQSAEGDDSND